MLGIEHITKTFQNLFDSNMRKPAKAIAAIILACSLAKRPGLSVALSTSNIIDELSKQGMPTGPLPDGTPNYMNKVVHTVVKEVYRAIHFDMVIQGAIKPGEMSITTSGANSGGPVIGQGTNINYGHFLGKAD